MTPDQDQAPCGATAEQNSLAAEAKQIVITRDVLDKHGVSDEAAKPILGYLFGEGSKNRPVAKLSMDGNKWCILCGENLQEGICGFGDTVEEACIEFMQDGAKEPEPKKKMRLIILPRLRDDDDAETDVEIDREDEIEWQLRKYLRIEADISDAEYRLQVAEETLAKAKNRREVFLEFLKDELRDYVVEKTKNVKRKYVDVTLDKAHMPEITMRIQNRKLQPKITVGNEAEVIAVITKKALPTQTEIGACDLIPEHWKLSKSRLNAEIKAADFKTELPTVKIETPPDSVSIKERKPKAAKAEGKGATDVAS